ncbi:MAG: hypothetical protein J6V09_03055 [Clostridia bacterium]|nr:hypothetical protein [Clostridia bacterium]
MPKKLLLVLICIAVLFSLSSCGGPKYSHRELVLNLPDSFEIKKSSDFDAVYTDGELFIGVLRISFAAALADKIPETMTATEFGELWNDRCQRYADVQNERGVTFSEYYDSYEGTDGYYFEAFYRSEYAYFVVLFATPVSYENIKREEIFTYAEGIEWSYK